MYIYVKPDGGKFFYFKYRIFGKEKLVSIGKYGDISLSQARLKRDELRLRVKNGEDPSQTRLKDRLLKSTAAGQLFSDVADQFIEKQNSDWSPEHSKRMSRLLERDISPDLGRFPVTEITPTMVLGTLRKIEARQALETTHKAKNLCKQIFDYAIQTGRCESNPCSNLKGALKTSKSSHMAAILDPSRLGEILKMFDLYRGKPQTLAALKLAPMLFVRPGELVKARWNDINLETGEWRFIVSKRHVPHIVPLANQAVEILRNLQRITGFSPFVFPGERSPKTRPISTDTLRQAIRSLGVSNDELTTHGFRATARTLLEEVLRVPPKLIEHQQGRAVRDPLGPTYNRTTFIEDRKKMMQAWADYLGKLKKPFSNFEGSGSADAINDLPNQSESSLETKIC